MGGTAPQGSPDLEGWRLPVPDWGSGVDRKSLSELYDWAERVASDAISWYLTEKKRKAIWSRSLRRLTVILATLGGTVPMAALAVGSTGLGNWGFALFALAGGCLAYDRFFGYSSAWLRYVAAATRLRGELTEFQLSWTKTMAMHGGRDLTADQTALMVDSVRAFVATVNEVVRSETESWLAEFHSGLAEMEAKLQPDSKVTFGERLLPPGNTVIPPQSRTGETLLS